MFAVVGFLFLGICGGLLMRKREVRGLGHVTTVLIWVLLFLLGIEVGSDRDLLSALPDLGGEALCLAGVTVLGSCLTAHGLWTYAVRRQEKRKEGRK